MRANTINRDLAVVRRILTLAARSWGYKSGLTWLESSSQPRCEYRTVVNAGMTWTTDKRTLSRSICISSVAAFPEPIALRCASDSVFLSTVMHYVRLGPKCAKADGAEN